MGRMGIRADESEQRKPVRFERFLPLQTGKTRGVSL